MALARVYSCSYISSMSDAMTTVVPASSSIEDIIDNFSLLDEWDVRYRYVIELGRTLPPLSERDRSDSNKVQGCASQVWLATTVRPDGAAGPVLSFCGDRDATIVGGRVAILFAMIRGTEPDDILSAGAIAPRDHLGRRRHLPSQRPTRFSPT